MSRPAYIPHFRGAQPAQTVRSNGGGVVNSQSLGHITTIACPNYPHHENESEHSAMLRALNEARHTKGLVVTKITQDEDNET